MHTSTLVCQQFKFANPTPRLVKIFFLFFFGSNAIFTHAQPVISSFTPVSGAVGTTVTITGSNFSSKSSNNIVYFGSVKATVGNATSTTLTVTVPTGARYSPISVTASNLTAYSTLPFDVTFPGGDSAFSSASFAAPVAFTTSAYFNHVSIDDFDGDGKPDILLGGGGFVGNGGVEIFRNTSIPGNVSFADGQNYTVGHRAWGNAEGDLDGDGKIDFVFNDYDNKKIYVFKNASSPGSISFNYVTGLNTWSDPVAVGIFDMNTDGKPDIALINGKDKAILAYLNTSTGSAISFAEPVTIVGDIEAFDVDNDGKIDMTKANQSLANNISIFRNTGSNGELSFAPEKNLATGISPNFVFAGDLDGDGKNDLAVSDGGSDSVSVFKNLSTPGNISFTPKIDFATGDGPFMLLISDLDGDSRPDIVTQKGDNTGIVSVLRNTTSSSISFDPYITYPTGGYRDLSLAIGDIDGDGRPDIVPSLYAAGSFAVLRNLMGINTDTCINAYGLSTTYVTAKGATLKWKADVSPERWQIQYKPANEGLDWIGLKLTGVARSLRITGLASNQKYKWRIRAKCGTGFTDFSTQTSFKTLSSPVENASMEKLSVLSLRPNPSTGNITVQYNSNGSNKIELNVYNSVGKKIFTQSASSIKGNNTYQLNLSNVAAGAYYLELINNEETSRIKFIISR